MRLDAWEIQIKLCRQSEMQNQQAQGETILVLERRQAIIRILDPADCFSTPFKQDMEETVVHELLHLHFATFEPEDENSLAFCTMEQTIDLLARLLVQQYRAK